MKFTVRALVAVALLVGFYVFALAVVAGLAFGVYELVRHHVAGIFTAKIGFIALIAILAIGRGLFSRGHRPKPAELPGLVVPDTLQPHLWAEARELAARAGTREPDEIRVVLDVNAAVSEDARLLGLLRGTRRLYVGLPLLVGLDRQQLRSVLAHEFGHYSGRHTALGGLTYRGQQAIGRVIGRLGHDTALGWLFTQYGRLYLAVSSSVSRQQELEADLLDAELVGPRTAASALTEIQPIDAAWDYFLQEYVGPGLQEGARPGDLVEGFSRFYAEETTQERLAELRATPAPVPTSSYDSHPPTAQRVGLLLALPERPEPDGGGSALSLLVDPAPLLAAVQDRAFVPGLRVGALAELVPAAAAAATTANADQLRAALRGGGRSPDLAGALAVLASPEAAPEVLRPLAPGDTAARPRVLAFLVSELAAAELVASGRATYRLSWAGPRCLVDTEGVELDPWTPAREGAGALAAWLGARGIEVGPAS